MKERVKQRVQAVLTALGFITKVKEKTMTNDDWSQFYTNYKAQFGITLEEDNAIADEPPAAPEATLISSELQQEVATFIEGLSGNQRKQHDEPLTMESMIRAMMGAITTMQKQPESSAPVTVVKADAKVLPVVLGTCAHSDTHLFGIEHPIFAKSAWYNQVMANRKMHDSALTTEEVNAFSESFRDYTRSITARVQELHISNQLGLLDYKTMASGQFAIDYGELKIEFGKEYLTRRQDMIIAYLRTLKTVDHIFPWRSGIQDGEIIPTAFFGEFSQRYQAGEVFKGSAKISQEIARVSDVMIKYKFEDLITLEKQYIGYLNKEGSDVMKWTFIEWLLVYIYKAMFNEQVRRRVVGVLVPVQEGVDNPAMFAADGVLRAIERVEEGMKVLPYKNLKTYTQATIVDYVEAFFEEVNKILPSLDGMKLYINEKHVPWYRQGFRSKYGTDTDYAGPKMQAIDYSLEQFVPVPNMDYNDYKMWITLPGNIESLQHLPGEMYNIYFERRLEALLAMGRWKEGAAVNMAGLQCESETELAKTKRKLQWIFTNFPVTELVADATEVDGNLNTQFITGKNTKATAITAINDAPADRVVKIICGNTENATTIAKSGKFEKITAAWSPTAVGDYIKLYQELHVVTKTIGGKQIKVTEPTGNWLELERKVTA